LRGLGRSVTQVIGGEDIGPLPRRMCGASSPGPSGPERGDPFPPGSKQSTIVARHFSGALFELRPELRVKAADAPHSAIE